MGFWSKIKNAVKKVVRVVKAVVRVVVRVLMNIVNRVFLGLPDFILGFLCWPRKRLRLYVLILSEEVPNFDGGVNRVPVVPESTVQNVVENTKRIYKKLFNVDLLPYSKSFIEVASEDAPPEAMKFHCGFGE